MTECDNCHEATSADDLVLATLPGWPPETDLCRTCLPVVTRQRLDASEGLPNSDRSDALSATAENPSSDYGERREASSASSTWSRSGHVLRSRSRLRHSVTRDAPHPRLGRRQLSGVTRYRQPRSCSAAQPGPLHTRQACAEHDGPPRSGMVRKGPLRWQHSCERAERAWRATPATLSPQALHQTYPLHLTSDDPIRARMRNGMGVTSSTIPLQAASWR
jgi:hypothetical protein